MTKFFHDFICDESGAAAAEYALILAIVGAGIATAAFYLGTQVSRAMQGAGDKVCAAPTGGTSLCP